jgi:hypothetical protein
MLKRGALLHADIAVLTPVESRARDRTFALGPGGLTLFMNDGSRPAQGIVNHGIWDVVCWIESAQ